MYFNDDTSRKLAFALVPSEYDLGRPTYPTEIYRDAIHAIGGGIADGQQIDRVLEIGSGTGQATVDLVRLSSRLDCIEPGKSFADLLRNRFNSHKGVTVHEAEFEQFQTEYRYDLVASACAIHWIPKEIFYSRVRSLLKPDGWLLGIWHQPRFSNAVYDMIQEIIIPRFPDFRIPRFDAEARKKLNEGFEEFSSQRGFRNCWKKTYSPTRILLPSVVAALIWSYIDVATLTEDERVVLQENLNRKISHLAITEVIDNFQVVMGQNTDVNAE